jgi:hypothetical protein
MDAHRLLPLLVVAALSSAAMVRAGQPAATSAADPRITTGRSLSQQFGAELKAALEHALVEKGPAAAIVVCRDEAPRIAARLSAERGVTVARTALRVRNPSNAPQPWQRAALESFEKRLAGGEKVEALESFEAQTDGTARYLKAIGTAPLCVACHGEVIAADIQHVLNEHYPQDQATGFKVGDLRGAFSIVWPSVKRASAAGPLN